MTWNIDIATSSLRPLHVHKIICLVSLAWHCIVLWHPKHFPSQILRYAKTLFMHCFISMKSRTIRAGNLELFKKQHMSPMFRPLQAHESRHFHHNCPPQIYAACSETSLLPAAVKVDLRPSEFAVLRWCRISEILAALWSCKIHLLDLTDGSPLFKWMFKALHLCALIVELTSC